MRMPVFTPRSLPRLQPSDERIRKACQCPKINAVRKYLLPSMAAAKPKVTYWEDPCESFTPWTGCGDWRSLSTDKKEGSYSFQIKDLEDTCILERSVSPSPPLPEKYWHKLWLKVYSWPGMAGRYYMWLLEYSPTGAGWGVRIEDLGPAGMMWYLWDWLGVTGADAESKTTSWVRVKIKVEDYVGQELYINDEHKVTRTLGLAFPKPDRYRFWSGWYVGTRTDLIQITDAQED